MSFSAQGIGVIPKDEKIEEYQHQYGIYLSFGLWTKNPYESGRNIVGISVSIPNEYIKEARESLVPGASIQVRLGELSGHRSQKGAIFQTVKTKWKWIEILKAMPTSDRKSYKDI